MSRICVITKKRTLSGNKVSHSNKKTRRKFLPNVHKLKFWVPNKRKFIRIFVSSKGVRIVNKLGIEKVISKYKINY